MTTYRTVKVDFNGQTWTGTYEVDGRMLRVSSAYGSKATQMGGSKANEIGLAQMMLRELVQAWCAKRR